MTIPASEYQKRLELLGSRLSRSTCAYSLFFLPVLSLLTFMLIISWGNWSFKETGLLVILGCVLSTLVFGALYRYLWRVGERHGLLCPSCRREIFTRPDNVLRHSRCPKCKAVIIE